MGTKKAKSVDDIQTICHECIYDGLHSCIMEKDAVLNLRVTIPYTDALVYSTESFKYKQSCILNKVIQTSHKEEIIEKNLQK